MASKPTADRRPGEPDDAWRAFLVYRDLGPVRSPEAVALQLNISEAIAWRWHGRWHWDARAHVWDQAQRQPEIEEQEKAEREMAERQVREAMLLQQKALQRLRTLDPAELSPMDAARLLTEGARLEREARKLIRET